MEFLTEDTVVDGFTSFEVELNNFCSRDSYNEMMIVDKISKETKQHQRELHIIAAHVAIVGVGKKNFGVIMMDGKPFEVEKLMRKHKIKEAKLNDSLKEDDLTLKRLTRVFRFKIKKFIENYSCSSYMFRKYSNHDKEFCSICFPGAEHLVETEKEILFLQDVYKKMDDVLGTTFIERYKRVIIARGFGDKLNL